MKLLQLNIWEGKLLREITKLLEDEQPDIVCLQEIFDTGDVSISIPDMVFKSLEQIKQVTGLGYSFFSPTYSLNYGDNLINYGNAIVSRYPILNQETVFVAGQFIQQIDITGQPPNNRNLQVAQLEIEGKQLTIANHHGYWQPSPVGNQTTIECMKIVADKLRGLSTPIILAGDLNIIASSQAMRVFDNFLEDLNTTYNLADTLSQLARVSGVACDHILVSQGLEVKNFYVSDRLVSDHKALLLDFSL